MRRVVVLGTIGTVLILAAVAIPPYGCSDGFVRFDPPEFGGMGGELVCVHGAGVFATAGEVSDRGGIKISLAVVGMIFVAGAAVFQLVRVARRRGPGIGAPEAGG
jgi:hypothetical protein